MYSLKLVEMNIWIWIILKVIVKIVNWIFMLYEIDIKKNYIE